MHIVFEWTITHLQTSHHAITTHTLIVLAEVYLVTGCSWLCYSAARVLVSSAEPVPTRDCR